MGKVQKLKPPSKIMQSVPEIDFSVEKMDTAHIKSFCNLASISSGYIKILCQPFALAHLKSVITPLNTSKITVDGELNPILYITYSIDNIYSNDGIYIIRDLDGLNVILNINTKTAIWVHGTFYLYKENIYGFNKLYRYEIHDLNSSHTLRTYLRGCVDKHFKSVSWAMFRK